jgi:hypothetical protein
MTASGSAKRARRRKRCSHRNRRSAGHQTRIPRQPPNAKTPVIPEPQATREIARSQFARIRTLVKYGMTVAQVAELYGAAVDKIERILRKA